MTGPARALLTVSDLHVTFHGHGQAVAAVRGIGFTLEAGRCLAIVGESGSGKSVTARALLGLAGPTADVRAGVMSLSGTDLTGLTERQWRGLRGREIGLVLQDALTSLDPLHRIRTDVGESLRFHGLLPRGSRRKRVIDALADVGVPEPELRAEQYPHQLSGGQRQRALIASALIGGPSLLIADEPTTALDVTVQAQVLSLIEERRRRGTAILMISHDLAVVARMADHILVMRDGQVVESGAATEVLGAPRHPYTISLLAAVPSAHRRRARLSVTTRAPAHPPAARAPARGAPGPALLEVAGITKRYRLAGGGVREVVRDVSFTVARGQTVGVVGESGSGKSTVARVALGLLRPDAGEVRLAGEAWSALPERDRRSRRGRIQLIHQDTLGSFDPRFTVAQVVGEAIARQPGRAERRRRVIDLLDTVGLASTIADRRPAELSGGQRQRVAIARALAPEPELLVCDEPVSALDVSIQAQILDLLADLQASFGLAMLFISHDLGVIHHLSDQVLVMTDGVIVERGGVDDVFERPGHPYTQALLAAVPSLPAPPAEPVHHVGNTY